MEIVRLVVGFDQREAIAYHVFCQSVVDNSSVPITFLPLAENTLQVYEERHDDGSNKFIYSRFLTPFLCQFKGWAIFADGDMICLDDIKKLWDLRDSSKAVLVTKHDYQTKRKIKYLGNKNENYPRKNWSSLILWNCEHPANQLLTPEFIQDKPGSYLHRFSWLRDDEIGSIPLEWNWLAIEYPENQFAKIIHYTLGTPCFTEFKNSDSAEIWYNYYRKHNQGFD